MAAFEFQGAPGRRCSSASPLGTCAVVHVGTRAVRLRCRGSLATITAPGEGLAPAGYEVGDQGDFARLQVAATATGEIVVAAPTWPSVDLTLGARRATTDGLAALASVLADLGDTPAGSLRHELLSYGSALSAALTARSDQVAPLARLLIGAGPGATPTGDDIVVGLHAALLLHGRTGDQARLAAAVRPLLPRTTEVSQSLLIAAADGRFASYVIALADATGDPALAATAVATARRTGAHTGLDTAHALVTAPSRWKDAA